MNSRASANYTNILFTPPYTHMPLSIADIFCECPVQVGGLMELIFATIVKQILILSSCQHCLCRLLLHNRTRDQSPSTMLFGQSLVRVPMSKVSSTECCGLFI